MWPVAELRIEGRIKVCFCNITCCDGPPESAEESGSLYEPTVFIEILSI